MSEAPAAEHRAADEPQQPTIELWVALGLAAIPQIAAFLFNGYGKLIVLVPVAMTLTLASAVAVVVAGLQLRADRQADRPIHNVVRATIILAVPWIAYAIFIGAIALMVHTFCVNQTCRGPLG